MTRSQGLYCSDILDRIQRIEEYTVAGREAFMQSTLRQDAVIRCFTVIGEAIKQLSDEVIATQPQIDWRGFAGFRDILVHQYQNSEMDIAWIVVEEDLPALKAAVASMLSSLDQLPPTRDKIK